ncbi:endo-1,4-beta-xylanase [Duganella caerulea]|uniref:polysaccharide deacetylase family protein n=1 Tax=Duganella caerulea TaxID=2885762 RepID=UPI0030E77571
MGFVFTCSIDDGHPSDVRLADLLGRHALPATFYFPVTNAEGAPVLAEAAMRGIARDFEVGSHTLDHRFLSRLGQREARFQIVRGKQALEHILGQAVQGFCYPGGAYRRRDVALVRDAGFAYARTTGNLFLGPGHDRYQMPTTCQFYPHRRDVYLRNFVRGGHWLERLPALDIAVRQQDWQRRLYLLLEAARRRGGVFHLWMHALDIDRLQAWPQLSAFLAYAASCTPPSARLTNGQLAQRFFPL